jgi:hypothetical protein
MATLFCAHCTRRIFLRHQQLPPASGLCLPCGHKHAEQQSADRAWRKFRDLLIDGAEAPRRQPPLLPVADLRHLL